MNLTINGKEYALHFGMDFIDEVEKLEGMKMEAEGVSLNMGTGGMALLNNKLASYHPSGLRTIIKAGTSTERQKPSNDDINVYLEELAESDDYEQTFDDIVEELGKKPLVLRALNAKAQ